MDIEFETDPSPEEWDRVLDSSQEGNYQQTFEYGEILKQSDKRMRIIRLLAKIKGDPVGIIQGGYHKSKFGIGGKIVVGGMSGGAPIVCVGNLSEKGKVVERVLRRFEEEAKRERVLEARIYWAKRWELNSIFDGLEYKSIRKISTFNIDLKMPILEVWKSFKSNKRKKIRRAIKSELEIQIATESDDVKEFYNMYFKSSERGKFTPQTFRRIKTYWDVYQPKGMADIFFVSQDGERIAGALVIIHKDTAYCPAAGSLPEGWEVRPNDFLHWKIMEWAHSIGLSKYNMGGVNPDPSSSAYGVYRWKIEYGGYLDEMENYEKVFMPKTKRLTLFAKKLGF